jgi:hypothetical protein
MNGLSALQVAGLANQETQHQDPASPIGPILNQKLEQQQVLIQVRQLLVSFSQKAMLLRIACQLQKR